MRNASLIVRNRPVYDVLFAESVAGFLVVTTHAQTIGTALVRRKATNSGLTPYTVHRDHALSPIYHSYQSSPVVQSDNFFNLSDADQAIFSLKFAREVFPN